AVTMGLRSERSAPAPVVPLMLDTPNARPELSRFAVSGDGTRFAFATDEGIAYRDAGQREYRLLSGTENGESPSFSPDGEWLVYQMNGGLRKVAVAGGSPVALLPTDSLLAGRLTRDWVVHLPVRSGAPRRRGRAFSRRARHAVGRRCRAIRRDAERHAGLSRRRGRRVSHTHPCGRRQDRHAASRPEGGQLREL